MFAIMLQTDVMSTLDKWDKALSYLHITVDTNVLGKVGVSWGAHATIEHSVVQNMPSAPELFVESSWPFHAPFMVVCWLVCA